MPRLSGPRKPALVAALLAGCALQPGTAYGQIAVPGQDGILIQPVLPFDYDQDRNTSLRQQIQLDYGGIGLRSGTVLISPRVTVGGGASDNPLLLPGDNPGDVYGRVTSAVDVRSDWARHRIGLSGSAVLTRFAEVERLNRTEWDLGADGRLDVGDYASVTAEARLSRVQEDPFVSGLDSSVAILSRYRRAFGALRGTRQFGRTRITATAAIEDFTFADLTQSDGTVISQDARDRHEQTYAAQLEYAFSPGLVAYAQGSYRATGFDLPGTPLRPVRDGSGWRLLAGANADLPGRLRGTLAAGFTRRTFNDPQFQPVSGFSAQGEVTWFANPLTNVTLSARRLLQEPPLAGGDIFFENSARLTLERRARRALLLGLSGYLGQVDYVRSPVSFNVRQATASAEYFAPRWFDVRLSASWTRREGSQATINADMRELAANLTLTFHP
ncbi:outer membrane beta-barrel protein [Croceibacterium sp. TMG7-5b_MA50]|uniref:outer membrane beta-barrel protein n=1 Tax=Croceibacterium sp. TMG7-5b_MA50 TaxID=3121290 RepID=UPI0032219889